MLGKTQALLVIWYKSLVSIMQKDNIKLIL